MEKILYEELSYQIMGIIFEVHNRLGGHFEEKYYQRAIEQLLKKQNIPFKKELKVDIYFEKEKSGKYFLDFLIDNKIILELKTIPKFLPIHFRQIRSYLKTKNLELGILVNLRGERVQYKRILNPVS